MDVRVNPMRIILLGTGTSTGVPEVGCDCQVCKSDDPRDRRLRSSALVITPSGKKILIDCGPDFRQQALTIGLDYLDAIILTHEHYDHVSGLDDLRTIAWQRELPIYGEPNVIDAVKRKLYYYFSPNPYLGTPRLKLIEVHEKPFIIGDVTITPIRVFHGKLPILGYRIGDMTYITDMKTIAPEEIKKFENSRLLIMNGLRECKPHPTHQSFQEAEAVLSKVNSRVRCYFTHLSHHAPTHRNMEQMFPENIRPAYDFMELKLDTDSITQCDYQKEKAPFTYVDWGLIEYGEALNRQRSAFSEAVTRKKENQETDNLFILCEHPPVITFGLHAKSRNLLVSPEILREKGIELFETERGGDITFHGPGQLVGYPILDLEKFGMGLKEYIHTLESGIIELLVKYGIDAERKDGATGVWLDTGNPLKERKICAIGVKSSRYITMHGFALNINTDLSGFQLMNPCGFIGGRTTSIEHECGYAVDFSVVKAQLTDIYSKRFKSRLSKLPSPSGQ